MKYTTIKILFTCIFLSLLAIQCKKDERAINLNLTEVKELFQPADNAFFQLKPNNATSIATFEWGQALAEDGSLVLYEVAFDQENGDFSHPFYSIVSDNKGVNNKLSITYGDLNKIATLGGADFYERKKFKWTVLASKGTNVRQAAVSKIIELERPGGFVVLPTSVYLSGTATEGGTTLANALPMKQTSPGVFEIYTQLTAGSYKFFDGNSGTPEQYYIYEDNGANVIGVNNETSFAGGDKTMKIVLDFNNISASFTEIKSIQLWYCAGNTFWGTLTYSSNGVWRLDNHTVNYTEMPWGYEERHKYKMVYDDGTGDKDLWLNYATNDSPGQDGQYPHTIEYKTINMSQNNGSQWDWGWKWDRNYMTQGSLIDFWVSLRASEPAYTVNYEKH